MKSPLVFGILTTAVMSFSAFAAGRSITVYFNWVLTSQEQVVAFANPYAKIKIPTLEGSDRRELQRVVLADANCIPNVIRTELQSGPISNVSVHTYANETSSGSYSPSNAVTVNVVRANGALRQSTCAIKTANDSDLSKTHSSSKAKKATSSGEGASGNLDDDDYPSKTKPASPPKSKSSKSSEGASGDLD